MPNPFKDFGRMYKANQQYLESQGKRSSYFGQMLDIPRNMHEAANATEVGMMMQRHLMLTNGGGVPATVTIDGVWQVGDYMQMSPVLRIQGRVEREDGVEPYVAVFDEVVAQMHVQRVQPGMQLAVAVDPNSPHEMGINWIKTGQLGPPPPGSVPPPGSPGARPAEPGSYDAYEPGARQEPEPGARPE